jgi:hypothetical protein
LPGYYDDLLLLDQQPPPPSSSTETTQVVEQQSIYVSPFNQSHNLRPIGDFHRNVYDHPNHYQPPSHPSASQAQLGINPALLRLDYHYQHPPPPSSPLEMIDVGHGASFGCYDSDTMSLDGHQHRDDSGFNTVSPHASGFANPFAAPDNVDLVEPQLPWIYRYFIATGFSENNVPC